MDFKQELMKNTVRVEEILKKYSPRELEEQKLIAEAMNYSLMGGGKRLRPIFMEQSFVLFHGTDRAILEPFMAAIEMIHTYSLVHDDLPAMDNDEYRRGRKTTHVAYGEAMGILAGDGLLNYAFETAGKAFDHIAEENMEYQLQAFRKTTKAIQILSQKAGIYGMIGGQVIDMEADSKKMERNCLDLMYRLKTGALIEASMMIGAVLAGAGQAETDKMEQIAGDIGLAFQIRDDILDVTGSSEKLGKPVHSDEKNEKITYVDLMNIAAAEHEVARISDRALRIFESLPYENEFFEAAYAGSD